MIATLAEVKTYLKIDLSDTLQDAFINQQIAVITEAIEQYCRRRFDLATYVQKFYGDETPLLNSRIELYAFPVKEIISITTTEGQDISGFRFDKAGIVSRADGFYGGEGIEVEYKAGFDPVPATVQSVLFSLVEQRFNRKSSGVDLNFGNDIQRISIPGTLSVDFDYSLSNNDRSTPFGMILGSYLNVLDFYRTDRAVVGRGTLTYVDTP